MSAAMDWALAGAVWAFAAGIARAESAIDGVWIADLSTQALSPNPDIYLVADGQYRCDSCSPPRAYRADGHPHPVPGDAEVITESVRVAGPRSIITHIVSPAMDRVTTMTVAADDRTATYVSIDHRPGIVGPLRTEYLARRTAPAPAGAHPVSGSWQGVRYVSVPEPLRTIELHEAGGALTYSVPLGVRYTAAYGGAPVVVQGPYGGKVMAAVRRLDDRTVQETRTDDGKVAFIRTFTVSADGRSLEVTTTVPATGATFRATSHRKAEDAH
jgi:hypothetical protein